LTSAVLDILKEQDVKATFFIIGTNAERYPEMVRREYEEGHGIGNHTYSHVFKDIYSSPEKYTEELTHAEKIFQSILGEDKAFKLTRFPGGSFGKALAPYREAVNQAGYLYVDWNSLNGDAETGKHRTAARLVERLKETVNGQNSLVVLMHDAPNKQTTIEALPEIIQYLRSENYRFELLPGSR
jgi:peptidoglycan/xylan/chitin deacetylase (PgdA/CDA1 family)